MLLKNILKLQKCLILLCVTCFLAGIWADGIGNHSEAIEACKGRGGLAKSELFRRVAGTWSMPSFDNRDFMTHDKLRDVILSARESAWVAGYAEFGEFCTLEGCQEANKWKNTYTTNVSHENNVFECGVFCKDNDTTQGQTVGLYQTKCVCFPRVVNQLQNSNDNCKTSKDNKLFTFKLLILYGSNMRNFQCGMIEHNGADWVQSSAKCLDSLSVMCNKHERKTERTDTWSDAVEFCGNASDKMHSHLTEAMITNANRSNKYWLSAFRSFRAHEQYSQNTKPCLSVTRTGNSLTQQPDDCGISQKYICADGIDEGNKHKIDDTDGKDDGNKDENRRSMTRQSTDKDGKPEEESKSSDNNSNPNNTTGIVIGMIALVVLVSLIIAVVICLRRRKATKGAHRPLMNESSTDTNVIKGTYAISNTHRVSPNENEYASPEDVTNTVGSTNPNNSKIRPDKPARNTLRRNQKLNETYENFKFVSTENRNVDTNEVKCHDDVTKEDKDEYDILCHNMATPLAKLEHAENHVYDHTTARNDDHECYDSTLPGRGNKHKPARNAEDYDTFNISNIENVDYNKDALWNDAHNEEVSSFGVLKLDLTPEEEQEPVYTESG